MYGLAGQDYLLFTNTLSPLVVLFFTNLPTVATLEIALAVIVAFYIAVPLSVGGYNEFTFETLSVELTGEGKICEPGSNFQIDIQVSSLLCSIFASR